MKKTFSCCLVLVGLILLQRAEARAQKVEPPKSTGAEQKPPAEDPLGRSTPKGTVVGLVTAAEQGNLDRAGEYLESGLKSPYREELAEQLWIVLNRKLFTTLDRVSNKPDGDLDDGLTDRDQIGLVESPSGNVEMFLERVQRGKGNRIWLFSASTLQEIPRLYEELQPPWFERYLPEPLLTIRWFSLPLYRWIALFLFIPLTLGVAALSTRALTAGLTPLVRHLTRQHHDRKLGSLGPLRLLVLAVFFYGGASLGLSLTARNFWHRVAETMMVIAVCWLSLRLMDVVTELSLDRLQRVHRSADTALVRLINRLLKAATVIVAGLALLYLLDVDLTAALTGLGVGGLAIGFGAQKTIENLFGGIMVISDKPVNVGDMCRVGGFFGTVEDIGIRSTRIRTLERTVVSVPNGQLASMSLENFTERDRILFQHTVGLPRQATPDQLRSVLAQIRRLLDSHPAVESTSARTRFTKVSDSSLELEIFAYVLETDQTAFLAVQEELLLSVMDIIATSSRAAV